MQLGRYQVLKQLATGDVANVHLARASGLERFARHVVLKIIRAELAREERLVAAFLEEARIAASLHHHNIVQVHDIGEQDGTYFFAMEYVHGEDVRKLLGTVRDHGEHVPFEHVVAIVTATAAGLHHVHEQRSPSGEPLGLVHRDVCPANILLGYDGSVKLVDFGMARAGLHSAKTASGALKTKASYMSPEQCVGKTIDRRTDTFALGIVLYELLTARRLYNGTNEYLTMAAIVERDVPPPSVYRPELPAALDGIVLRALARAPDARYQTADALREALEHFATDHALRASNKALADYTIARFGQRTEPWLTDAEAESHGPAETSIAVTDAELVLPATNEATARDVARSSAPVSLSRPPGANADVDDSWGDGGEPSSTTLPEPNTFPERPGNKLREAPVAAEAAGPTLVAPTVATPTVAAAVVEAPVVKAPVVEAPVVEKPVVETPIVATPTVAAPVVEALALASAQGAAHAPESSSSTHAALSDASSSLARAAPALAMPVFVTPVVLTPAPVAPAQTTPAVATPSLAAPTLSVPALAESPSDDATSPPTDHESGDATVVAPPVFVHEDSTVQRDPAELAAERAATRNLAATGDDESATFEDIRRRVRREPGLALPPPAIPATSPPQGAAVQPQPPSPAPAVVEDEDEPPPLGDEPSRVEPPLRARSEHIYVGPPAPPEPASANLATRVRAMIAAYGSVLVAGGAAAVVLAAAVIAMRACG